MKLQVECPKCGEVVEVTIKTFKDLTHEIRELKQRCRCVLTDDDEQRLIVWALTTKFK